MTPTNYLTASETVALVSSGEVSLEQVIQDHKERYQQRNDDVRAWVVTNFDNAKKAAGDGPLRGVTIGVKDMMNTADMPTEHGSRIYKGSQPGVDAAVVGICRAAGASIIGKTTTTEFAATHVGTPTRNAVDQGHTPGGSSSGSAAAVADFQCHIGLGTQTLGSIVRPASFNGIFGYKPTWGTISRDGAKISGITLDTIGFFSRSITDLELMSRVFELFDPDHPAPVAKSISECRFGFVATDIFDTASGDVKAIWTRAQDLLKAAGAQVETVDLGKEFEGVAGHQGKVGKISTAEGRVNFLREYRVDKDNLDPALHGWVKNDIGLSRKEVTRLQDDVAALRPRIDEIAGQYDALVTPSVIGEALAGIENTGSPQFCAMWTGLHVPVINIPGFAGRTGMPIGLTLVAPRSEDERLLQVAKLVGKLFIGADEGKLKHVPTPEGVIHLQV